MDWAGCLPKRITGLRGNQVNAVDKRPLIDFELPTERNYAREDDNLRDLRQACDLSRWRDRETRQEASGPSTTYRSALSLEVCVPNS